MILGPVADKFFKFELGTWIQVGKRFIKNYDIRSSDHCPYYSLLFLVSFGKIPDIFLTVQYLPIEEVGELLQKHINRGPVLSAKLAQKIKVFLRCKVTNQKRFIYKGRCKALPVLTFSYILASDLCLACTGFYKIKQQRKQRCFTCTVVTHQSETFPLRNLQKRNV